MEWLCVLAAVACSYFCRALGHVVEDELHLDRFPLVDSYRSTVEEPRRIKWINIVFNFHQQSLSNLQVDFLGMELGHFAVDSGALGSIVDFVPASPLLVAMAFFDSIVALEDIDGHNAD